MTLRRFLLLIPTTFPSVMKIIFIQWTSRKRTFIHVYLRSEAAPDFETLPFLEFFIIIKRRTNEIKFWIIIFHLLRIKVQIFEA